jgi:hypothetical protein
MLKHSLHQQRLEEYDFWASLDTERTVLRTMTYLLLLLASGICVYINLIFSIKFSPSDSRAWLASVLLGAMTGLNHVACCDK